MSSKPKLGSLKDFSRGQNRLFLRVEYEGKENTSPPPRKWILNSLLRINKNVYFYIFGNLFSFVPAKLRLSHR